MDGRLNPEPLNHDKQPNIKQVYRKHCANINILRSPLMYLIYLFGLFTNNAL